MKSILEKDDCSSHQQNCSMTMMTKNTLNTFKAVNCRSFLNIQLMSERQLIIAEVYFGIFQMWENTF